MDTEKATPIPEDCILGDSDEKLVSAEDWNVKGPKEDERTVTSVACGSHSGFKFNVCLNVPEEKVLECIKMENIVDDDKTDILTTTRMEGPELRGKRHIIEPAIFLIFMSASMFETVYPNQIESQYCRVNLNISQEECFSNDTSQKSEIQHYAARMAMIRQSIEILLPSLMSFFVGPWSDTYGRKPLMLAGTFGYFVSYSMWTWSSSIDSLDPVYYILNSLALAFSGGATVVILSSFCYICDVTSLETRAFRFGLLQATLFLGTLAGAVVNYPGLLPGGYPVVFAIAAGLAYLAMMYTYFFIDESIVPSQIQRNATSMNPFNIDHLRDMFAACYTRRTPKIRLTIFLLVLILSCSLITAFGEFDVMYLFLQRILQWNLTEYTFLNAFVITMNAVGAFGGIWLFSNLLKLHDLLILSFAAFFRILSAITIIYGYRIWHIYFSRFLACSLGISGPIIRSFLSGLIPAEELGKVFSLIASGESLTPFLASVLYTFVYEATVDTYPEGVFILSAFLLLIMLLILTVVAHMYIKPKNAEDRSSLIESEAHCNINSCD